MSFGKLGFGFLRFFLFGFVNTLGKILGLQRFMSFLDFQRFEFVGESHINYIFKVINLDFSMMLCKRSKLKLLLVRERERERVVREVQR